MKREFRSSNGGEFRLDDFTIQVYLPAKKSIVSWKKKREWEEGRGKREERREDGRNVEIAGWFAINLKV